MAEQTTPTTSSAAVTTGAGSSNGAATQTQPSAGGGDTVSIPRSEYDTYVRHSQQVKGFQPFHERATKAGFKSVEDFDKAESRLKMLADLEQRGITVDRLGRMFSPEADADLNGDGKGQQQPAFDPVKFEKDLDAKMNRRLAEREYEDLSKREKDHVDSALRDALGDEAVDEMSKSMYRMAIERWLDTNRESYPKEHPLHDSHLQPIGESQAKKAVEWFKAEKAKHAGSAMKKKADEALGGKPKPSTSAGAVPGQGKPQSQDDDRRGAEDLVREHVRGVLGT